MYLKGLFTFIGALVASYSIAAFHAYEAMKRMESGYSPNMGPQISLFIAILLAVYAATAVCIIELVVSKTYRSLNKQYWFWPVIGVVAAAYFNEAIISVHIKEYINLGFSKYYAVISLLLLYGATLHLRKV